MARRTYLVTLAITLDDDDLEPDSGEWSHPSRWDWSSVDVGDSGHVEVVTHAADLQAAR